MKTKGTELKRWQVVLPHLLLTRWKAAAKQRGMTGVALLRLVMTRVLDGEDAPVGLPEQSERAESRHLSITLRKQEIEAVKAAAADEGHTTVGWIAGLLRARLKAQPVFTAAELEALSKATLQLSAVGRNLNSAVYRLHRDGRWLMEEKALALLGDQVRLVTERMNKVVDKASDRGRF